MTPASDRHRRAAVCAVVTVLLAALCYWPASVDAYKSGSPTLTCGTMAPGHGVAAQSSPAPYRLFTSDNVTSSQVSVTLTAPRPNDYFVGFLIEARVPGASQNAVGSFTLVPRDSKTLDCNDAPRSGVTHINNAKKNNLEFVWEVPRNFDGQVHFVATVLYDFSTFWVGLTSNTVRVIRSADGPPPAGRAETGGAESELRKIELNLYDGCGKTKNCVGAPQGCLQTMNCLAVVAVQPSDDGVYLFEMLAQNSQYVAFGLSDDTKMGGDGVIECVHQDNGVSNTVNSYKSWNIPNRKQNKRVEDDSGVAMESAVVIDGAIHCKLVVDARFEIEENTFDLDDKEYFILLAAGSSLKPFSVGYHDVAFISSTDKRKLGQLRAAPVVDPFYNDCGDTKTCFGTPSDCLATQDCSAVTAVKAEGTRYIFEMKAKNAAYVAVGLSNDQSMGGDSVMECVHENVGTNQINAYMSWNIPNQKANKRLPNQNGLSMTGSSYVDGTIYCSVVRDAVTQVEKMNFDLIRNKYYLLLASGASLKEGGVGYHDLAYTSTAEASTLSEVRSLKTTSKLLVKLHGSFMIVAWIGAASIGIVIARYYRQTWVGASCCSKDLWFGWHRLLMMFTWILTLAGSACIFIEIGEWVSSGKSQTHALLGVVTTVLAFFQPIFAAFRPHPDSSKRAIFNWIHWLVGNAAHIFSILTIFLASGLGKAELPGWADWIVAAYVAFYVVIHLILSISGCLSEKSGSMRINTFPMKDLHNGRSPMSYEQHKDAPHSGFRKFWLFIHVLFIVLITAFLVLMVVFAPIESKLNSLREHFNS